MSWINEAPGNGGIAKHPVRSAGDQVKGGVPFGAWDPHEVWLRRVKEPRDLRRLALMTPPGGRMRRA